MNRAAPITAVLAGAVVAGYLLIGARTIGPPTITLLWSDTNAGAITFNVYSGPEPRPSTLRLLTNVSESSVTLAATNAAEFFGVRAVRDGSESDWAEVAR